MMINTQDVDVAIRDRALTEALNMTVLDDNGNHAPVSPDYAIEIALKFEAFLRGDVR